MEEEVGEAGRGVADGEGEETEEGGSSFLRVSGIYGIVHFNSRGSDHSHDRH